MNNKILLNEIRIETVQSMKTILPKEIANKFKLVSDTIVGDRYRSAWIGYDEQQCVICEVSDYTDNKCPVKIVKFGF